VLTVVSPEGPGDVELVLEPNERMKKLGVVFRTDPTSMGMMTIAIFEDTCGNLIQIYQV
jgi:hypothetical protein